MRACCLLALLWGASGKLAGCALNRDGGPYECGEDTSLADATSLLQARHAAAKTRKQEELVFSDVTQTQTQTRRCLHQAVVPQRGDCVLGSWSDWDACTQTCGSGTRQRSRTVLSAGDKDGACGCTEEAESCNTVPCPDDDCHLGEWSEWSPCSCDMTRSRSRTATSDCDCVAKGPTALPPTMAPFDVPTTTALPSYCDDYEGQEVCDTKTWRDILVAKKKTCTEKDEWTKERQAKGKNLNDKFLWCMCPEFCKEIDELKAAGWSETALVQAVPVVGATCSEVEKCLPPLGQCSPLPPDCHLGEWSEWSSCSCDMTHTRSRTATGDCESMGEHVEVKECHPPPGQCSPLPPACHLGDWSEWSPCSCDTPMRHRSRAATGDCESMPGEHGEVEECMLPPGSCYTPSSHICGTVKSAMTNEPVEGAQVKASWTTETLTTDASGEFCSDSQISGGVTLTVAKDTFITKEVKRTISDGFIDTIFISPEAKTNDWRIVLEWGTKPLDLDAHTQANLCEYSQSVYWDNKECEKNGVKAMLDLDHCFPDGTCDNKHTKPTPETTTIANVDPDTCRAWGCKIFFCVHNYSGSKGLDEVDIKDSEAVVSVSHGSEEVATYTIKDIAGGKMGYVNDKTWHAFWIHGVTGKVYPCNGGNCPCYP